MQFEISHELDVPLDALESALMSPDLGSLLADKLESIESVEATTHDIDNDEFRRVWRFQAKAPLKILSGFDITRDMMTWDESWTYRRNTRAAEWHVVPRPGIDPEALWRQRFDARGTYHLEALSGERTMRTIAGSIAIRLKLIGRLVERMAVAELRRAYDAEADALQWLCKGPVPR